MTHYCEGEDIKYDFPSENKIRIYLKRTNGGYLRSCKCFGTHYLEQTLDEQGDVITEVIKENPYWVDIDTVVVPVRGRD